MNQFTVTMDITGRAVRTGFNWETEATDYADAVRKAEEKFPSNRLIVAVRKGWRLGE